MESNVREQAHLLDTVESINMTTDISTASDEEAQLFAVKINELIKTVRVLNQLLELPYRIKTNIDADTITINEHNQIVVTNEMVGMDWWNCLGTVEQLGPEEIKSNIENADVSNVTNMNSMFSKYMFITDLDLSRWDVSNVTDMHNMFSECHFLISLDLSGWDITSVESMSCMFYNCDSLTNLDLSNWNTCNVKSMNYMFVNCSSLNSLDLGCFDVEHVQSMDSMFYNCSELTTICADNWNMSNSHEHSIDDIFTGCDKLEIPSWI